MALRCSSFVLFDVVFCNSCPKVHLLGASIGLFLWEMVCYTVWYKMFFFFFIIKWIYDILNLNSISFICKFYQTFDWKSVFSAISQMDHCTNVNLINDDEISYLKMHDLIFFFSQDQFTIDRPFHFTGVLHLIKVRRTSVKYVTHLMKWYIIHIDTVYMIMVDKNMFTVKVILML